MQVVTAVAEMKGLRARMGGSVGLVPTMGYLHEGHLSLVRRARRENDSVVVSIFVNPTQFGPGEDYEHYPRNTARDLDLLASEGADLVFMPTAAEVYPFLPSPPGPGLPRSGMALPFLPNPPGPAALPGGYGTYVEVGGVTEGLEGASRPGHFRGVATVVLKLFNIVRPHRAYFGQKDYQQLLVIKKMARELDLDVEVVPMPTVREADGLAMSSRNAYLSAPERQAATVLWRALCRARELCEARERRAGVLRLAMETTIQGEPLARIDYVSVADAETLEEMETLEGPAVASLAVRIGQTRLIDNILLL